MTKKYKILGNFIKDMSSETPDIETYLEVKQKISQYKLQIDINSKPVKNKLIEINTILKFADSSENKKKSYFEIVYVTVINIIEDVKEKKDLEKIILCDVQNEIYPKLEGAFLNLMNDSGYPGIKIEKKIDFEELYKQRSV